MIHDIRLELKANGSIKLDTINTTTKELVTLEASSIDAILNLKKDIIDLYDKLTKDD